LFEWLAKTKDGRLFWAEVNARFVQLGQEALYLVVVREISERKKADVEREKFITELENRNAELERFTYTVSHDLKSPLVTIRGFLGYVEKDALHGDFGRLRRDMERITEATDKMQRLLNELLELSRIGRMVNPPEAIPFEAIVREAMALTFGRCGDSVMIEVAPGMPVVWGDRIRLVEVVQNLLDNACKFAGDQLPQRIEIGQKDFDSDGKPIFFIRDSGIGIEPQHLERIFGLFEKLNPKTEGTGVGLALVRRIIESHGGKIWVESQGLGTGSTFYFTLPIYTFDQKQA
jgi:signal transduction histidine kinase